MAITIVLADAHEIIREGLRLLLSKQKNFELVGLASNGRKAVKLSRRINPDVVVLNINMPDLNGIDATYQIHESSPDTKIIALSMFSQNRFARSILMAGASSFIPKEGAIEELITAINTAVNGLNYNDTTLAVPINGRFKRNLPGKTSTAFTLLSQREREVLQLIAEGKSTKEIADQLYISIKTIGTHRRNIMKKLNANSVAELIKYSLREGLTFL